MFKNNRLFLIFILILVLSSCNLKKGRKSEKSIRINQIISISAKIMKDKYNMHPCLTDVAAMRLLDKLGLGFQVCRILTKDEAREILLSCVWDMIEIVNNNDGIQPFLPQDGFTEKNVRITLFIRNGKNESIHPDLGVASFDRNSMHYLTYNPNNEFGYKSEENETLGEAISLNEEYQKQKQNAN